MEKKFLTLLETADYLGLAKQTIYYYTHKKLLNHYKLHGRKLYFLKEDLDKLILNDDNLVKSEQEVEQEATKRLVTGE